MREETYRYWGLYAQSSNRWLMRSDGSFVQFSAPSIAQSYLFTEMGGRDDLEVREFGTEAKAEESKAA